LEAQRIEELTYESPALPLSYSAAPVKITERDGRRQPSPIQHIPIEECCLYAPPQSSLQGWGDMNASPRRASVVGRAVLPGVAARRRRAQGDEPIQVPKRWLSGDFAGWLRQAMSNRGMSRRALAMRSGINHSTIARLLSGEHEPRLTTALALLRVLDPEPLRAGGEAEVAMGLAQGSLRPKQDKSRQLP
jgi:DNA-binding XRE family transcriptional regulator